MRRVAALRASAWLWALKLNPVVRRRDSGRVASASRPQRASAKLSESYRFLTIGLSYKVIVVLEANLLQSDRTGPYKVIVDNLLTSQGYPQLLPQSGRGLGCFNPA